MTTPLPIGIDSEALVLIGLGPVPFMVAVSGLGRGAIVEAYRRVGLPLMHEQVVVVDRLMASSCRGRFHRWASCQAGFLAITLGSSSPRPNPQKPLLARDLLVVACDLTAAG